MRKLLTPAAFAAASLLAACGGPQPARVTSQNSPANSAQTSIQHGTNPSTNVGVASSHGGAAGSAEGPAARPPVQTPELDTKIQKAEAKAKAAGASDSDKRAAAAAYFERADFYRDQGVPALYKFALADYRRGLRYDPSDAKARGRMDEIVQIYQSMGRPVPELGNEQ